MAEALFGGVPDNNEYLPVKGEFSDNIDSADIEPGFYVLNAFAVTINGTSTILYGTFKQYPGTYKVQEIVGGPSSTESRLYSRRYLTASSSWTPWANGPTATSITLTPSTAITSNRVQAYVLGNILFFCCSVTVSSTLATNTTMYTIPAGYTPVGTIDMVASTNAGSAYFAYANSSGYIRNSGSWPANTYQIVGFIPVTLS